MRPALLRRLRHDRKGVALIEFALVLPIFVMTMVGGAELANYISARMRVSQMALQIADNASRIGTGTKLSAKKITEADINDLFLGAQLESGGLDLKGNGRVILSDLEPTANTDTNSTYRIGWQRCFGSKTGHGSSFGKYGVTSGADKGVDMAGMGPTGTGFTQAIAPKDGATMFVEVYYEYKPLIASYWVGERNFVETATMMVRDRRDLSDDSKNADGTINTSSTHPNGIYKVSGVTASTC